MAPVGRRRVVGRRGRRDAADPRRTGPGSARIYGAPLAPENLIPAAGASHPDTRLLPQDIRTTAIYLNMIGTLAVLKFFRYGALGYDHRAGRPEGKG